MGIESNILTIVNISDKSVFRDIFTEYYAPLCLFANKYLKDHDTAADIVQDTFAILWTKREDFSSIMQVKSFLYTCVRNKAMNELRHLKVIEGNSEALAELEKEKNFSDDVVQTEVLRLMRTEIGKLPKQMSTIMTLSLEGKKNKEIADILHITTNTVRTLKRLAYKKLRKNLSKRIFLFILILIKTL